MSDLTAFLRARLDEDEGAAKAAQLRFPGPWQQADRAPWPVPAAVSLYDLHDESVGVLRGSYVATHIARHDPARVLRDVEAKRAILDLHRTDGFWARGQLDSPRRWCSCGEPEPCSTGRHVAAVYADHPDYQQEWKP